jgi:hypothetical protein
MFCPNCGKEIPDTSKVCGYCGNKVPVKVEAPPPASKPEPKPATPPHTEVKPTPKTPKEKVGRKPISSSRWVGWLVGGLLAVGINYLGGYLSGYLSIKGIFYLILDSIGTASFAIYAGPIGGVIVGALFQLLVTLTYSEFGYYFIPVHVVIALVAWGAKRLGWLKNIVLTALAGAISAVLLLLAAWPSIAYLFIPPDSHTFEFFTGWFMHSIGRELLDKTIVFLIVWVVFYLLRDKVKLEK